MLAFSASAFNESSGFNGSWRGREWRGTRKGRETRPSLCANRRAITARRVAELAASVGRRRAARCGETSAAVTTAAVAGWISKSGRRIRDLKTLRERIRAWSNDVNTTQRGVDWQMKIDDARCKLNSVYPKIRL